MRLTKADNKMTTSHIRAGGFYHESFWIPTNEILALQVHLYKDRELNENYKDDQEKFFPVVFSVPVPPSEANRGT